MRSVSLYVKRRHSGQGQGLVEVVTTLAVLMPALLVLLDCIFIGIGAAINDTVARDAARAAASGPPGVNMISNNRVVLVAETPYQRAVAVSKRIYGTNLPMKVRDTLKVRESINDIPPASMGGAVEGEMSVETTIDIYPPFLVGAIVGPSGIALKSKHIVPVTYVVPAS